MGRSRQEAIRVWVDPRHARTLRVRRAGARDIVLRAIRTELKRMGYEVPDEDDEAKAKYHESEGDEAPIPSEAGSYRNDDNTGWVFTNVNGYLAHVPDHGGVLFR